MTEGMNRAGLVALYEYHSYATKKLLDAVDKLTDEQLSQEISLSHGTLRRLLQHMLGAETFYLAVCQGHSLDFDPTRFSTLEDMRAYWDGLEHRIGRYIEAAEDNELGSMREFRLRGDTYQLPVWKLLIQAFTHAIHHRGEISIILSQLGQPLPTIDIIQHFIEQSSQKWK
jgi:uncharacterized damage-inducible protein DinB